jgi:hypothetical protein
MVLKQESMSDQKLEILRHGCWSSGYLNGHVWIVRQDWDYYHEEFYDEEPSLNEEGWAYYALYGYHQPSKSTLRAAGRVCLR